MTDISGDLMVFAYNYGIAAHDDLIKIIDKFCTINENELDELANEHFDTYEMKYDGVSREEHNVAYKAGYRKAMNG